MGFDVAGDYLFVPYTGASREAGFSTGHIEVFRLADGAGVGHMEPSRELGEIGLQDIRECLRLIAERTGRISSFSRRMRIRRYSCIDGLPEQNLAHMAKRQSVDDKLAAVRLLRDQAPSPEVTAALRAAIADRSNLIVAAAAAIAGEQHQAELAPVLETAFQRFMNEPEKTDKLCRAKLAIIQALDRLRAWRAGGFRSGRPARSERARLGRQRRYRCDPAHGGPAAPWPGSMPTARSCSSSTRWRTRKKTCGWPRPRRSATREARPRACSCGSRPCWATASRTCCWSASSVS